jgi:hypothetical protein
MKKEILKKLCLHSTNVFLNFLPNFFNRLSRAFILLLTRYTFYPQSAFVSYCNCLRVKRINQFFLITEKELFTAQYELNL